MRVLSWAGLLLVLGSPALLAHAVPVYTPVAPVHVSQRGLFDATGRPVLFSGVQMRGLEVFTPTDASRAQIAAMSGLAFRVIHQRWNMNTVRLPISPWIWQRDGGAYLDRVAAVVARASQEGLWTVLVAADDSSAGSPFDTGLPGPEIERFWSACATRFKDVPTVIFSLYRMPSSRSIPGASAGARRAADWIFWRNGGTVANGRAMIGMQQLAARIREAGAKQVIAAPAFGDALDFTAFETSHLLSDENVIYEVYPFFDHALTDSQRNARFGFLASRAPMYAGEWGTPLNEDSASCRSIPADANAAITAVVELIIYMINQSMSWTAASFEPGSLVTNLTSYDATELDRPWTCGASATPQPGMGRTMLELITGDRFGFGSLLPELVANAAGNRTGPVAPGEIISIYGQGMGPDQGVTGTVTEGQMSTVVGETRVLVDGIAAPVFFTNLFQVNAQIPFEVAGRSSVVVQEFYRDVPSNPLTLPVAAAVPGLFTAPGLQDVLAINQDGQQNSSTFPAPADSVVALFGSGLGQTSPAGVTGRVAGALSTLVTPPSVRIGGLDAEILYAGDAPGLVGVTQINVRIPAALAEESGRQVPIVLSSDGRSTTGLRLWIR